MKTRRGTAKPGSGGVLYVTPLQRKIGGRTYYMSSVSYTTKRAAQKEADRVRKLGYLARVLQEYGGKYSVYTYPRGKML